jgi:hypothetical protein
LPWLSNAFVLEHMHSTFASITTTMWVAYICTLWKVIPEIHIKIETWPILDLKLMETLFVHYNITFWITNKSNHFMPYFLVAMFYMHVKQATSNKNLGKSHPFLKL